MYRRNRSPSLLYSCTTFSTSSYHRPPSFPVSPSFDSPPIFFHSIFNSDLFLIQRLHVSVFESRHIRSETCFNGKSNPEICSRDIAIRNREREREILVSWRMTKTGVSVFRSETLETSGRRICKRTSFEFEANLAK